MFIDTHMTNTPKKHMLPIIDKYSDKYKTYVQIILMDKYFNKTYVNNH